MSPVTARAKIRQMLIGRAVMRKIAGIDNDRAALADAWLDAYRDEVLRAAAQKIRDVGADGCYNNAALIDPDVP